MMKRSIAWLLAFLLCFCTFLTAAQADTVLGDVNLNNEADTADAAMILRYSVGLMTLTGQALTNADANQDGKVNAADAAAVLRYTVKLDTLPPSGQSVTPQPSSTATPTPTPTPTPAPSPSSVITGEGKVTATELYVRSAPSKKATHVATIVKGDVVNTYEKVKGTDDSSVYWYHISYTKSGKTYSGYILAGYLSFAQGRIYKYVNVEANTNLLSAAGVSSTVLYLFSTVTKVGVLEEGSEYWKVRTLDGKYTGYVYKGYLIAGSESSDDDDFVPTLGAAGTSTAPATPIPNGLTGVLAEGVMNAQVGIWSNASANSTKLKVVASGAGVYIFGMVKDADGVTNQYWYKVQVKTTDVVGYVVANYVTVTKPFYQNITYPNITTTGGVKYLYASSSTSSTRVATLYAGDAIGTTGGKTENDGDQWYSARVLETGVEGWILVKDTKLAAADSGYTFSSGSGGGTTVVTPWTSVLSIGTVTTAVTTRENAGVTYSAAGTLAAGATIYIFSYVTGTDGETWCKIKTSMTTADYVYIPNVYVSLTMAYLTYPAPSTADGFIYLRASSSTSSTKVTKLYADAALGVLGYVVENDGDVWLKVTALDEAKSGYVLASETKIGVNYALTPAPVGTDTTIKIYKLADDSGSSVGTATKTQSLGVFGYSTIEGTNDLYFHVIVLNTGIIGYVKGTSVSLNAYDYATAAIGVKLYKKAATSASSTAFTIPTVVGVCDTVKDSGGAVTWYKVILPASGEIGYIQAAYLAP